MYIYIYTSIHILYPDTYVCTYICTCVYIHTQICIYTHDEYTVGDYSSLAYVVGDRGSSTTHTAVGECGSPTTYTVVGDRGSPTTYVCSLVYALLCRATAALLCMLSCVQRLLCSVLQYTAYGIRSVISSLSNLNRYPCSLRFFHHVPLKRDQGDWRLEIEIK